MKTMVHRSWQSILGSVPESDWPITASHWPLRTSLQQLPHSLCSYIHFHYQAGNSAIIAVKCCNSKYMLAEEARFCLFVTLISTYESVCTCRFFIFETVIKTIIALEAVCFLSQPCPSILIVSVSSHCRNYYSGLKLALIRLKTQYQLPHALKHLHGLNYRATRPLFTGWERWLR